MSRTLRTPRAFAVLLAVVVGAGGAQAHAQPHAQPHEQAHEQPHEQPHEHGGAQAPEHAVARASAAAPPLTDADRAAAFPDLGDTHVHDTMVESPFNTFVLFDELEGQDGDDDRLSWDFEAWLGRELERVWIRSDGARASGTTEDANLELLWGRSFARWWTFLAGARRDFAPGPDRSWAAVGIQGLAPYWVEIEATAYVGEGGRLAASFEAEREVLLAHRLILEPAVELSWHSRSDPARGIGAGLSAAELALRLRYELRREVAPYVGVVREKRFGSTADFARAAGADADETRWVAGVRFWF